MDWKLLTTSSKGVLGRIFRGIILAAWIGILVWFGGLAATNRAAQTIIRFFTPPQERHLQLEENLSPSQILRGYLFLRHEDPPPPLEALLDLIVKNPSWIDRHIAPKFPEQRRKEDRDYESRRAFWVQEQFFALFARADSIVNAIVSDRAVDPKDFTITIPEVPQLFRDPLAKGEATIKLPRILTSWIEQQRIRQDEKKQTDALVNTFFILIALGAFGSLIFLTKDYIEHDVKTPLAAYFFRPVLGMFLSMAVFLIDMLAHSVISTADILKVRHETLYVLALAAGLLSEQAYTIVSERAQAALEKLREKAAASQTEKK